MTEANLQAEGPQGRASPKGSRQVGNGRKGQFPHNLPMWSPVKRLPTGHLNMNYCLSIQVILTDELGEVPPPLHSWTTPVIEDMLQET